MITKITAYLKTSTLEQRWSAINTLIITAITQTPLCGFLFQCGCDWPWRGLDSHCNFYKPHAQHRCPWCASMVAGILSTGVAMMAGIWSAATPRYTLAYAYVVSEVCMRTAIGIMMFVMVAIICAGIVAGWQAYPLGIGTLINY